MSGAGAGTSRVETLGSFWMIDDDLKRYCRFPKHEGPRERPEWGGPDAGSLQDAVWHDFEGEWAVVDMHGRPFLRIQIEWDEKYEDWRCVFAPDPEVLTNAG